jgi:hypothetical protein
MQVQPKYLAIDQDESGHDSGGGERDAGGRGLGNE